MNPMFHVTYGPQVIAVLRSFDQVNAYVARITAERALNPLGVVVFHAANSAFRNEYVNPSFR